MKHPTFKTCVVALGCAALFAAIWRLPRAQAQPSLGKATDFSAVGEYFDPPHEKQPKCIISGKEAQPLSAGRYLLKMLKIETFRVNGEPEMILEAPECLYDSENGLAGSPGHLQVQSGDGRFSVAGDGFLWQQSQGNLTISNQIRAVVQRTVTNTAVPSLVITSRWFSFDATNHNAVFHDDVHGGDPEMKFTCGQLTVRAAPADQSFEVIEAEQSPAIIDKVDGRRATADRMIYTRADERAELFGNVTWQRGRESGRANRAVLYRRKKNFAANGHVVMKLPRESLGAGSLLLAGTNAPSATSRNSPLVNLLAEEFHSQSNRKVAEGSVYLIDGTNRLSCDKLTMQSTTSPVTNETATADGNVVVERGGGTLHAARAVYTRSDATTVFTGDPKWTQAQMEGQAERVTVYNQTGEIRAENDVVVKIASGAQRASFLTLFPVENTNRAPREIKVFARALTAWARRAVFLGDVRAHELPISGSEPRLQSGELEVDFTASHQAESVQARQNVVYEQGLPGVTNGPAIYRKLSTHMLTARSDPKTGVLSKLVAEGDVQIEQPGYFAKGGLATYTAATDVWELTEQPWLERPDGIITDAQTLFWDRRHNRVSATGLFKIIPNPKTKKQPAEKNEDALR